MKNLLGKTGSLVIGGLCVAGALPLSAATLYNNLTGGHDLGRLEPGINQVGDQIGVAGGSPFNLNQFTFQYWGESASGGSFAGNVQVQVSFFANNGTPFNGYATPGTLLGQSQWDSIPLPTFTGDHNAWLTYNANEFTGLQTLPANFTWAVQFRGMGTGDHVGVDYFDMVGATGQNYPDFWFNNIPTGFGPLNNINTWELRQFDSGSPAMFFGASIDGVVVPEPSTWIASSLLLLPLAGTFMRLRKNEQKSA